MYARAKYMHCELAGARSDKALYKLAENKQHGKKAEMIGGDVYVGFSAQYGWQAVFNTFGALAIAAETYGLQGAVSLNARFHTVIEAETADNERKGDEQGEDIGGDS